jgi:hypothetical protein
MEKGTKGSFLEVVFVEEKGGRVCKDIVFKLEQKPMLIGRHDTQKNIFPDIEINSPWVSRRHAEIFWDEGRYFLRDVGSTGGTKIRSSGEETWNRVEAQNSHLLRHGDCIMLAEERALLSYYESDEPGGTWPSLPTREQALELDEKGIFKVNGKEIKLGPIEFDLLNFFYQCPGRAFDMDRIAYAVWAEKGATDWTIQACIHRVNEKIGCDPQDQNNATGIRISMVVASSPTRKAIYRLDLPGAK